MLRRLSTFAAVTAAAAALPAAASAAWLGDLTASAPKKTVGSGALFVVSGHGWGHGVGMSQYGAYGFAQHGWGYQKIVTHYFPGTTIGPAPVTKVRVLLVSGKASVSISSPAPFTVKDATGAVHDLDAGEQTFGPGFKLQLADKKRKQALPAPLAFVPAGQPLALGGRHYRGQLQVDAVNGKLRVIDLVPLESYLYGVVPSEMPHSWHPEALKAQAVVARSYALAVRKSGPFDLYPDTRSQVYLGADHEFPESNAAVDATAGQVVLYEGAVARTYFFSTSGGRTASSADIWGGSVPYLVPVSDPYDSISPYHDWGPFAYNGSKLARGLHVPGPAVDAQTTLNSSGRVANLTVTTGGGSRSFSGTDVRGRLGLRSTWFSVGVLALQAPNTPVVYGSSVQLTGTARAVQQPTLQQQIGSAPWRAVATVRAGAAGAVGVSVRPLAPSRYRLATRNLAAGAVRVKVAPAVRFSPDFKPNLLQGTVRPVLPGSRVAVQRLEGTAWKTVARAAVDASGRFEAQLALGSGSYRARAVVGHGFSPGTSPTLKVSTG